MSIYIYIYIVILHDDFSSCSKHWSLYVGILCIPVSSSLCYMAYNSVLESIVFVDKRMTLDVCVNACFCSLSDHISFLKSAQCHNTTKQVFSVRVSKSNREWKRERESRRGFWQDLFCLVCMQIVSGRSICSSAEQRWHAALLTYLNTEEQPKLQQKPHAHSQDVSSAENCIKTLTSIQIACQQNGET